MRPIGRGRGDARPAQPWDARERFQQLGRHFLSLRNSQGVVSLECHSVAEIGFGLRIFWDGGTRL